MSYVLSIKRREGEPPLCDADILRLLESDPTLKRGEGKVIYWSPPIASRQIYINLDGDRLWTDCFGTVDDDAFLEKLRSMAQALDAALWGEEGEEITSDELGKHTRSSSISNVLGVVFVVLLAPVMLLTVVVRLLWWLLKFSIGRR